MDKEITLLFGLFTEIYIVEERIKNRYELGFMEQYMYPKCLGLAALLNLEDHIMTRRFNILKVYVHMYSTLGRNN